MTPLRKFRHLALTLVLTLQLTAAGAEELLCPPRIVECGEFDDDGVNRTCGASNDEVIFALGDQWACMQGYKMITTLAACIAAAASFCSAGEGCLTRASSGTINMRDDDDFPPGCSLHVDRSNAVFNQQLGSTSSGSNVHVGQLCQWNTTLDLSEDGYSKTNCEEACEASATDLSVSQGCCAYDGQTCQFHPHVVAVADCVIGDTTEYMVYADTYAGITNSRNECGSSYADVAACQAICDADSSCVGFQHTPGHACGGQCQIASSFWSCGGEQSQVGTHTYRKKGRSAECPPSAACASAANVSLCFAEMEYEPFMGVGNCNEILEILHTTSYMRWRDYYPEVPAEGFPHSKDTHRIVFYDASRQPLFRISEWSIQSGTQDWIYDCREGCSYAGGTERHCGRYVNIDWSSSSVRSGGCSNLGTARPLWPLSSPAPRLSPLPRTLRRR